VRLRHQFFDLTISPKTAGTDAAQALEGARGFARFV